MAVAGFRSPVSPGAAAKESWLKRASLFVLAHSTTPGLVKVGRTAGRPSELGLHPYLPRLVGVPCVGRPGVLPRTRARRHRGHPPGAVESSMAQSTSTETPFPCAYIRPRQSRLSTNPASPPGRRDEQAAAAGETEGSRPAEPAWSPPSSSGPTTSATGGGGGRSACLLALRALHLAAERGEGVPPHELGALVPGPAAARGLALVPPSVPQGAEAARAPVPVRSKSSCISSKRSWRTRTCRRRRRPTGEGRSRSCWRWRKDACDRPGRQGRPPAAGGRAV